MLISVIDFFSFVSSFFVYAVLCATIFLIQGKNIYLYHMCVYKAKKNSKFQLAIT